LKGKRSIGVGEIVYIMANNRSGQKMQDDSIEKFLKEEKKEYAKFMKEAKVLLLGSSDSGKSTVLKQLKILHGGGFTDEEKAKSALAIWNTILISLQITVKACIKQLDANLQKVNHC
jgi:GTPase SAR1 family protein